MKTEDLIYVAGLMDGEGTITMNGNKGAFRSPSVGIASTSWELIEFLKKTFGGTITAKVEKRPNRKPGWDWRLSVVPALEFLKEVSPYMKEKRKLARIEILLEEYPKLRKRRGYRYSDIERAARFDFEKRFFAA